MRQTLAIFPGGTLMRTVHLFSLTFAALLALSRNAGAQAPAQEKTPDYTAADEQILREHKEQVDGPGLLAYFRKRTFPDPDPKRVALLIRQLGDRSFKLREQAREELLRRLSLKTLDTLREAERSNDHEVRRRAINIRIEIEGRSDSAVESAAARLVAVRRPEGAAAVLLNFLPFAADESVVEEICQALPAVALRDGRLEAAVLAALTDKLAIKRGAAGAALVKAGAEGQLPAVRALLKDPSPAVQLRVAQALVTQRREKDAVDSLIATLGELPAEQLWQAEELLIRIAGDKAPQISLGTDAESRQKCRRAWEDWWAEARDSLDLKKVALNKTFLGYTLIVQRTFTRIVNGKRMLPGGQVQEVDKNQKVRWKIELSNVTYPVHAQMVSRDRVLIAEFSQKQVTERDLKGNVKWTKIINGNPLAVQRLPNGHTFIVQQNRLLEVDRQGKEVYQMDRPMFDIFRARKLRNGEVVFITAQGVLHRIDPKGNKTIRTFNVGPMGSQFGSFDVLPNGNFLVAVYGTQEVVEFDPNGNAKWRKDVRQLVPWPTSVQRLPNGNTLVSSQSSRRVVEINRQGQEVWSLNADGQVFMAHRR